MLKDMKIYIELDNMKNPRTIPQKSYHDFIKSLFEGNEIDEISIYLEFFFS